MSLIAKCFNTYTEKVEIGKSGTATFRKSEIAKIRQSECIERKKPCLLLINYETPQTIHEKESTGTLSDETYCHLDF